MAWACQQARLLRAGQFELLDREHIAEEIEDVGKSEQRELASRMAVLPAHLLKWRYQPRRRGSGKKTILAQRKEIAYGLQDMLSLARKLRQAPWLDMVWAKAAAQAVAQAVGESGFDRFPDACPWTIEKEALNDRGLPG